MEMGTAGRPGRPRGPVSAVKTSVKREPSESRRYIDLINGVLNVEDLTDDEILQGRILAKDGTFRGRPPEFIPREMYAAMTRELRARMNRKFEENAIEAVETIVEIMREGEGAEETEFDEYSGKPVGKTKGGVKRLDAAKYIVERVLGQLGKDTGSSSGDETTPWDRHKNDGTLIVDIEPDEDDAHLITGMEERRKPIRRKMVQGEVID